MALDIDGYAVLKAIADAPDVFRDIRADAAKAARALVVKQIKAKALPLPHLRRIRAALGPDSFALVVDGLTDAEVKSLTGRLDRHHPDLAASTPDWRRRHLAGLADAAEPAAKAKAPRAPRPAAIDKPKVERALAKRPFAATWDGKDHDAPDKPDAPKARRKKT